MPNRPTREQSRHLDAAAELSRLLKDRRTATGLSQQALAQAAGLSIGTVRAIEGGRTVDPGLFTVIELARALEVDLMALLERVVNSGRDS